MSMQHMPSLSHQPMSDQAQQDSIDRARAYKSRNKRPCDFCRYKKAACHLDSQPPCELCIRYNKDCTFVESPAKRRRPNDVDGSVGRRKSSGSFDQTIHIVGGSTNAPYVNGGSMDLEHHVSGWDDDLQAYNMPGMVLTPGLGTSDFGPYDPALYQEPMTFDEFDPISTSETPVENADHKHSAQVHRSPMDASSASILAPSPTGLHLPLDTTSGEPSLDNQASSNAQIVGMSGEIDPYLLSRYRYDQYNEATFQSIRIRKMNEASVAENTVPAFFTIAHNALASKAQPVETTDVMEQYRHEVEEMVNDDVGKRLIRLFYKYVQPYFPVLTREGRYVRDADGIREPRTVSTCILAAIYGHALPFCAWDEKLCVEVYTPPSADALFRIAWLACQPTMHTPSLAVLQTILLLVQRRPTNKHVSDTPVKWVMMTEAVSLAQALGLNRDPTDWPLPSWEIKVRKRLAWATFVQDKWLALNFGRASHIQADDWDVPLLSETDFADADREGPDAPAGFWGQHFAKLAELTVIVDDIMHSLFSLRATKALQGSLDATLEVAKPLRIRLTEWHHRLPAGLLPLAGAGAGVTPSSEKESHRRKSLSHDLDGNCSLYLAYITAKIELFRAMLRPEGTDANSAAVTALRTGALTVAREVFEFLEGLNARELEAFWGSYARTNFTIASSFILLLFVTAPTLPDAKECLALLTAWRSLLRIKSRSCDLLNLALLRLDGVFVAGLERLIEISPAAARAWGESGLG
ncbi:hypothetical protein LTR91_018385 [Friedmanniomyces endolithicus]|uniref:Zn(2)-C6 fungal-type domain-containing protein n=1 Tax=Friedmanniomyces endolithicus TaxID=329885 RepID=A0AAN6HD07_9PEZI|nr:hypothetical protein LTR75_016891 [Friedmanniomyces endolithicus]KAK0852159.1 hypothetical protein LTR03_003661 [Friedmanniomyces endolithicus]KAK0852238.1 hypothetical protein LTS02_012464 [Friedmanniomyces endolithicus]KAK0879828.1 hypothetical protein LTR87_006314 [Friedmanniomyces endolithicus]KAK0907428.1 hypothetical protein LTR57_017312 [Friedmanniomyces endolithicus]